MIALGRPLLADPDIPNKIMRGEFEEVRPCLSCQEGCMGRLAAYAQIPALSILRVAGRRSMA